jgi:P27 family predicted phage terminase small subunit
LSAAGRALWTRLQGEYDVRDAAGLAVLEQAMRSWERAEEARRQLDKEGVTFKDRWGQRRPHPAVPVERDARAAFLQAIKQLGVEIPEGE